MKKKGIIFLFLLLIVLILAFYLDSEIIKVIQSIHSELLTDFFISITNVSSVIIIFFILTSLFLWKENKRRWILPLWFTLSLSIIVSFILKIMVQRERPFQLNLIEIISILEKTNFYTWNFSFPSFQAMLAFCAVPILAKEFPRLKYVWVVFAVLIAFSRVYFGLHFLSDVIAGGLIGYLLGMIVIKIENENRFWGRLYKRIWGR